MRKGIAISKQLKKGINISHSVMSNAKYNVNNYKIDDSFNLQNSVLKDLNIETPKHQLKLNITANDIDKYNLDICKKNKQELKSITANLNTMRLGLVGVKVGMTSIFDKFGVQVPLSVIKVENNQVVLIRKINDDKYSVEVGCGFSDNLSLAVKGHLYKNNIPPKKHLASFKVTKDALLPIGYIISPRHFLVGQKVDVQGISKGKGTEGVMQRWNFKGLVKTHGCSLKHRAAGSIGNREFPARVWPGKKMAGKSGNEWITCKGLTLYKTDFENGLLYVLGGIPGNPDGKILIKDSESAKSKQYKYLLNPTFLPEEGKIYENVTQLVPTEDLLEKYPHDNDERLGVSDEEEEGPPEEEDEMEAGSGSGGAAAPSA